MALSQWVQGVRSAVTRRDGDALCQRLSLTSEAALYARQQASSGRNVTLNDVRNFGLPDDWPTLVVGYLQALVHLEKGEYATAAKEYREKFVKPFVEKLNSDKSEASNWLVPPVMALASALKQLSESADNELVKRGQSATQLSECAIMLQRVFSALNSKTSQVKRDASVAIVCLMMKLYFKLNTINNCKQPLKAVDSLRLFDNAKISHRVTLRYYTGRLAAYDEDFVTADEHLTYAFTNCTPASPSNQRKVLRYLIPVKMLLGVLPSDELLQRYNLLEYRDIRTSVATGNVALLMRSLEEQQVRFIQSGTYLLLEKLQLATYRRLFKKCFLVNEQINPGKAHQVPIALFESALRLQGIDKDDLELQCVLANLIYRKYIKGYLAYKARVVVLAKTDPFPPLASVQLSDPFML